jgi:hypothetical protein
MAVPTMKSIAKKKGYVGIGGGKYKTPGKNTVKWTGKKFKIIAGPMFGGGPFRPLSPGYKTNAQFNAAVDKEARAGIRPELANIRADTRYETEGSKTRQKDISGWYGWQQGELNDAFHDANLALSNLIATNQAGDQASQQSMQAALRGDEGASNALAQQLGTMPPQSNDAQIMAAALQSGDASQRGVLGTAEAGLLGMANQRRLSGVGANQAHRDETGRLAGFTHEQQQKENELFGRLPGLRAQIRDQILSQEAQKATNSGQLSLGRGQLGETTRSNKAQEKIAWSELGLKARQERFNEWLGKVNVALEYKKFFHSSKIDWANVKLNKTQIMNEGLKIKFDEKMATGTVAKAKAKAKARKWDKGVETLAAYQAALFKKGKRIGYGEFSHIYRTLTGQIKMSRKGALKLLMASDEPIIRQDAKVTWWKYYNPKKYRAWKKKTKKGLGPISVGVF